MGGATGCVWKKREREKGRGGRDHESEGKEAVKNRMNMIHE